MFQDKDLSFIMYVHKLSYFTLLVVYCWAYLPLF
jgi:hypothetical protein